VGEGPVVEAGALLSPTRRRRPLARPWYSRLAPSSLSYATLPVEEAFNWTECATDAEPGEWYLVAFRSVRRECADDARLDMYDRRALREAKGFPGFMIYFKGTPNERRECLSFCLWESREHARAAARGSAHVEAITLVREMYEVYSLEFLRVRKQTHAAGLEFEPFDRVDRG
jgi:heme-degrading monooxygenase HmoA